MFSFKIDMAQFRAKAKIHADTCDVANTIDQSNGNFQTLDPQRYLDFPNDCCIFYTCTADARAISTIRP